MGPEWRNISVPDECLPKNSSGVKVFSYQEKKGNPHWSCQPLPRQPHFLLNGLMNQVAEQEGMKGMAWPRDDLFLTKPGLFVSTGLACLLPQLSISRKPTLSPILLLYP